MKVLKAVVKPTLSHYQCDVCGNNIEFEEVATLTATWGFYSKKDLEKHHCDLCEKCYDKVATFIEDLGGVIKVTGYGGNDILRYKR